MSTLDRADAWNAQTVLAPFNVSLLVAATQYADERTRDEILRSRD
jgi:hypothetical protein